MDQEIEQIKFAITKHADLCVKCGMCSLECPTYQLQQNENESPRGRIAIAQAIASDNLALTASTISHLDNCLHCLRCEKICPSGVQYGELVDSTFQLINKITRKKNRADFITLLIRIVTTFNYRHWQIARASLSIFKMTGLFYLTSKLLPKTLSRQLQFTSKTIKPRRMRTTKGNNVSLFIGCLSNIFDQDTIEACKNLLLAAGYNLNIPKGQTCCGAIALHKGQFESAQQSQRKNLQAFADKKDYPILFMTSGCGATLKTSELVENSFILKNTHDITSFLADNEPLKKLTFNPLNKKVLIHSPCSEKNVLKKNDVDRLLTTYIDKIQLTQLNEKAPCCGASGSYMITNPELSGKFRDIVLAQIITQKPDIIVSGNYTCAMHLQMGLKEKNIDIPVIHPIRLLWEQLVKR